MLQVVRRDNHVCQVCHQYVPDTDLEFDHIIPYSKGGPTTVGNIRLLCQSCNRKKSDSLRDLLVE
jgi:5-methylcytosine-specific restriction endonuclease McrA